MNAGQSDQGRHPCPLALRGGTAGPATGSCLPACADLYQRLSDRLAVPAALPAKPSAGSARDRLAALTQQAQWLARAIDLERDSGLAGSWRHDRHRLAALRHLRTMALCMIRCAPSRPAPAAPNENDRRGVPRRS